MKSLLIIFTLIFLLAVSVSSQAVEDASLMSVALEWYGHSCFLLTLENGAKILIDPYDTTRIPYSLPAGPVDVVFSTHDHMDHNATGAVVSKLILKADGREPTFTQSGVATTIRPDASLAVDLHGKTMICSTVPSFHDDQKGKQRGFNGLIRWSVEGMTFVHLGDLGDTLNMDQIAKLQPVDVLMIPVGGFYTIDAAQAKKVVDQLNPHVIIPMHYKTEALPKEFPITTELAFLKGYTIIHRNPGSTITLRADRLPEKQTVEVLKYHDQK